MKLKKSFPGRQEKAFAGDRKQARGVDEKMRGVEKTIEGEIKGGPEYYSTSTSTSTSSRWKPGNQDMLSRFVGVQGHM